MTLISLHIPKTGGTTFLKLLKTNTDYKVKEDFRDRPLHFPRHLVRTKATIDNLVAGLGGRRSGNSLDCIHGHFLLRKYKYILSRPETISFACIRHPLDRLISHYNFWKKTGPGKHHYLHRKMLAENWSFQKFAMRKELQNIQSYFVDNFSLAQFTFIARFESLESDYKYFFSEILNIEIDEFPRENIGLQSELNSEKVNMEEIVHFHQKDFTLFEEIQKLHENVFKS